MKYNALCLMFQYYKVAQYRLNASEEGHAQASENIHTDLMKA